MLSLAKEAAKAWSADKAARLGAALAYYTVFSLAPLLVIAIGIGGMVFGEEAARGQIVGQLQGLLGRDAGEAIQAAIQNASKPGHGPLATIIGVLLLLFGASGVFVELRGALNTIWKVPPEKTTGIARSVLGMLRERFLSFAMVLGVGFLLLVSLVLSAVLEALVAFAGHYVSQVAIVAELLNIALSVGMSTVLFAMIYRTLPQAKAAWRDVWPGAILAGVLFALGKFAIGAYIGHSSVASVYGAAGSLVVILLWTYFSAQILLFGAEYAAVHARRRGEPIVDEAPQEERSSSSSSSPLAPPQSAS